MTDTPSRGFLALSAELRLQVYDLLVTSCLDDGIPHNASGLYLSCKTIHKEMEAENISKTRAIFNIQKSWNTLIQPKAPLRIQTLPTYNFVGALSEITILIPACDAWDPRMDPPNRSSFKLYRRLYHILSRAFKLTLSTLKLKFYYPSMMSDVWWGASIVMADYTLGALYYLDDNGQDCLRNIGRLDILLGTFGAPPSPLYGKGLKTGNDINSLSIWFLPRTRIWWIEVDRKASVNRWTLCYKLEEESSVGEKGSECLLG